MGRDIAVRRLDLGYFVRPASETDSGQPRVEPVLAYLVRHERGLLLFDTRLGAADPGTEAHYRPRRRALQEALSAAGAVLDDISVVVNCHLHFDHCGGNPLLGGRPVLVQDVELATARRGNHTFDELVDFPGVVYEELTGETEIWPGVRVVPTRGTPRDISPWSCGRTTAPWSSPVRPMTSHPGSRRTSWPATPPDRAWSSRSRPTRPGWTGSPISTPGVCSSHTTARSGNRRRAASDTARRRHRGGRTPRGRAGGGPRD